MLSAKSITAYKSGTFIAISLLLSLISSAQENSPYSRYGIGDLVPNQNMMSRGMGGISASINDNLSINLTNPAALAGITNTIFDLGAEADFRTLKSSNPAKKSTAANSLFSYMTVGFPIASRNMVKHNTQWGFALGLKPVSRINYKISSESRINNIDSSNTLYEGSGGTNQAFIGTALKFKNGFSIGIQTGYMFGTKDYSTRLSLVNDTVIYYLGNWQSSTHFGGMFLTGGLQYEFKTKKGFFRAGVYGSMMQKLKATRDDLRETFNYNASGGTQRLDSVFEQNNIKGTIELPSTIGAGFSYEQPHLLFGLDYETSNWNKFMYYGQKDALQNNWVIRGGMQYLPTLPTQKHKTGSKGYFSSVYYRAGIYYGQDYINVSGNKPVYAVTLGTGMRITALRTAAIAQELVMLNTALEIGSRGNKQNNLRENIVRFSIGLSMNARWFLKPKYY